MENSIVRKALERVAQKNNESIDEVIRQIEIAYLMRDEGCLSDCTATASEIVEGIAGLVLERLLK